MALHIKQLLSDLNVASIASTRLYYVNHILEKFSFRNSKIIVELGPGDGVFTKGILSRMSIHSRLLVIETNLDFVHILRSRFHDPRIEIIHDSACNIQKIVASRRIHSVDAILSGVPLTLLNSEQKQNFFDGCFDCLHAMGQFGIYQSLLPGNRAALRKILAEKFKLVDQTLLSMNLPPLFVTIAREKKKRFSPKLNLNEILELAC